MESFRLLTPLYEVSSNPQQPYTDCLRLLNGLFTSCTNSLRTFYRLPMNSSGTPKERFKHPTNSIRTFHGLSKNFLHTLRTLQSFLSKYPPRTLRKLPKNTLPTLKELSKTLRPSQNSPRTPYEHSSNPLRIFFELKLPTNIPPLTYILPLHNQCFAHSTHSTLSKRNGPSNGTIFGCLSTTLQEDRRYAADAAPTNPPRK